jgi:antitoxin HicB
MYGYRIDLHPDDNDTYLATCPSFPELTTYGADEAEALRHAKSALDEAIAGRIATGAAIPDPDGYPDDAPGVVRFVVLDIQTAMKVELYQALKATGRSRADLSRQLGWHREQVDRLFRLGHASRLEQIQAAAAALGYRVHPRFERAPAA